MPFASSAVDLAIRRRSRAFSLSTTEVRKSELPVDLGKIHELVRRPAGKGSGGGIRVRVLRSQHSVDHRPRNCWITIGIREAEANFPPHNKEPAFDAETLVLIEPETGFYLGHGSGRGNSETRAVGEKKDENSLGCRSGRELVVTIVDIIESIAVSDSAHTGKSA